jgi:hypothetical protein
MTGLSVQLRDLLDDLLFAEEAIHRAKLEASQIAAEPSEAELRAGAFFKTDAISNDSWRPSSVALRAERSTLAKDYGWAPLGDVASADNRTRSQRLTIDCRVLRLRDVAEDLFIATSQASTEGPDRPPNRTLAKPLVPGEVLVSTLGSSFRTAYVDEGVPPSVFPSDGWVRLRFRETPAAWALLLSTEQVRSQAARITIGTAQQFIPPEALLSLHLPIPERDLRERWQRTVERHHAQMRVLEGRSTALATSLATVFDAVHKPFAVAKTHCPEVLQ